MKESSINISIVSHGHFSLMKELGCLPKLAGASNINVYILDNIGEQGLEEWCAENCFIYLKNENPKGFGENNNIVFDAATPSDYFLVLNPDVNIEVKVLQECVKRASTDGKELVSINLYKNKKMTAYDPSVRRFPGLLDFVSSYIGLGNKTLLDKATIQSPISVDWASGSFLLFSWSLYKRLAGFDDQYYMYCEDIDICFRAKRDHDIAVWYYPMVKALHLTAHANRKLFSKHFYWHVTSVFKFLLRKYGIIR